MKSLIMTAVTGFSRCVPEWLVALVARIALFRVFWFSGQTKLDGWEVTSGAIALFQYEYALPVIPPETAAWMAAYSEVVFAALLLVGFLTQLGALALLCMTLVIQFFVYPDAWSTHILWVTGLLFLMRYGGGALSIDHMICRTLCRDKSSL